MSIIQDFTIFEDDDVTPLIGTVSGGVITQASCSTDPTHPRPYMKAIVQDIANSEIKFKEGTSIMGGCNVEVVDVPLTAGDQTTGWFTALLASHTTGNTQILMRRAVVRQMDSVGVMRTVFDGVMLDPLMQPSIVTYSIGLRSIRERERQNILFQHANTTSIVPAGAVNGYGQISGTSTKIVQPVGWEYGTFHVDPSSPQTINGVTYYSGRIDLHDPNRYSTQFWSDFTDKRVEIFQQYGAPNPVYDPTTAGYVETRFPLVLVEWRQTGTTNAFYAVPEMPQPLNMQYDTSNVFIVTDRGLIGASVKGHGNALSYITVASHTLSDLPTDGEAVDFRVVSNGPPSKAVPLVIESPFFQLLADIYDGKYSYDPVTAPRVRYDPVAMAALIAISPMARALIDSPADDMYTWVAENIYKPLGYAPGENENGQVTPISLALPDYSVSLITLNDTNVSDAQWTHTKDDAVSSTLFTYQRDYVIPPDASRTKYDDILHGRGFDMSADFDRLTAQDVQIRRINVGTSTLFGDKPIEYSPVTVRTVTTSNVGNTLTGDVSDELGSQLANAIGFKVMDRFGQGAQTATLTCINSDAGVNAAQIGQWVVVGVSWLPDYGSYKRGMSRLMQITKITTPDAATRSFVCLDAGIHGAIVVQPTIASLAAAGGIATVAVTSVPTGAAVTVQYAISPTVPSVTSPLWTFMGRVTVTQNLSTPPLPNGATIWVRAFATQPGRRSSAFTANLSLTLAAVPVVSDVAVVIAADGTVRVTWVNGANTAGVHVAYALNNDPTTWPTLSTTQDGDATLNVMTLTGVTLTVREYIFLTLTPYSAFSGGVASGTRGNVVGEFVLGNIPGDIAAAGVGPNLTVTPEPGTPDSTHYTILWSGDSVLVSIDNGTYVTPSVSPIVVARGSADHVYAFSGVKNGQTVSDSVTIPALGVNTVTPDLTVTPGTQTSTTEPFTVTAVNPAGGTAPTITVTIHNSTGSGSSVGAIAADAVTTVPSGEIVTVNRPAFNSLPASATFRASISGGNGAETIGRSILNQDKLAFGPNLTITVTPGAATYSIAWSGDGVLLSINGAAYGTPSTSPISVSRNAPGGADITYGFTGVKDSQTVSNTVVIPAQSGSTLPVGAVTPTLTTNQTDATVDPVTLTMGCSNLPATYTYALYKGPARGNVGGTAVASGSNSSAPLSGSPTYSYSPNDVYPEWFELRITIGTSVYKVDAVVNSIIGLLTESTGAPIRATPWNDGYYPATASNATGYKLDSNAVDARSAYVNTMFRTSVDTLDNVTNGSTYNRTTVNQVTGAGRAYTALDSSNIVVAGSVDFARGYTNKTVDNIADGATHQLAGGVRGYGGFTNSTGGLVSTAVDSGGSRLVNAFFSKTTDTADNVSTGATYRTIGITESHQNLAPSTLASSTNYAAGASSGQPTLVSLGLAIGDVISISGLITNNNGTDTQSSYFVCQFYNGGTLISEFDATAPSTSSTAEQAVHSNGITVPAACTSIFFELYTSRPGGAKGRRLMVNRGPVAIPFTDTPLRINRDTIDVVTDGAASPIAGGRLGYSSLDSTGLLGSKLIRSRGFSDSNFAAYATNATGYSLGSSVVDSGVRPINTMFNKTSDTADNVSHGSTFRIPLSTAQDTSGNIDFSGAGFVNKTVDHVGDGATHQLAGGVLGYNSLDATGVLAGKVIRGRAMSDGYYPTMSVTSAGMDVASGVTDAYTGQYIRSTFFIPANNADQLNDGATTPLAGGRLGSQALNSSARIADETHLPMVRVGNVGASQAGVIPLGTPTWVSGTSSWSVAVAGQSITIGGHAAVTYNSGSITGLASSTTYWVYVDDPGYAGGSVTYHAVTSPEAAAVGDGYYYVGAVTTGTSGGGGSPGSSPGGGLGGACFEGDTPITMADGTTMRIDEIEAGDLVVSFSPSTGTLGTKRVTGVMVHDVRELLAISTESARAITTPEHPFYLFGGIFAAAGWLRHGDYAMRLQDGGILGAERITSVHPAVRAVKVYNIEVEDWHTYIAGGFAVHNIKMS